MRPLSKAPRVRLHFFDAATPSVEGILVARRHREYVVDIPELVSSMDAADRVMLEASRVLIPRENIALVEVLS